MLLIALNKSVFVAVLSSCKQVNKQATQEKYLLASKNRENVRHSFQSFVLSTECLFSPCEYGAIKLLMCLT